MSQTSSSPRLDRPVDRERDHSLGPPEAPVTLVEYGSYACPHCRAADERVEELRREFGDRLRFVFRHRPIPGSPLADRAAELAELADQRGRFWEVHERLMTRSEVLSEDDLRAVTEEFGLATDNANNEAVDTARARVEEDVRSARASGVLFTPSFYINSRQYEGLWEEAEFRDALLNSLGHRMRSAALDFARWAPSAGVLLLLATIVAVVLTNSPFGAAFLEIWETPIGLSLGESSFRLPLLLWVNDALLTLFFLVVGLEIKREFTIGHLANRRAAALPIAAAIGGMGVPVLLYKLIIPTGAWQHGWGVPMATDTAFAVALIVMLGSRVPIELRIFLTAAAIIDDIGAILVVALFYTDQLHLGALGLAVVAAAALALLNKSAVYRVTPYVLVGVVLWVALHESGLHATLAGVLLAVFLPARRPPNLRALLAQAQSIFVAESRRPRELARLGPSEPALTSLDAIHDRLESPAARVLRLVSLRSNYFVLPLFALANAGVVLEAGVFSGHTRLMLAIMAGLVLGKPIGFVLASWLAVRLKLAVKPAAYSWAQLGATGALAGIGFTMSLFIAGQAFPAPADFDAAKIAVFAASILAAVFGVVLLVVTARRENALVP